MGSWQQPWLHSGAIPAQSALTYCVCIQPETQAAKQPQPMFWNGLFQGFGGFWGGVYLVFWFFRGLFVLNGLMLIAGIISFTSESFKTNKEK